MTHPDVPGCVNLVSFRFKVLANVSRIAEVASETRHLGGGANAPELASRCCTKSPNIISLYLSFLHKYMQKYIMELLMHKISIKEP